MGLLDYDEHIARIKAVNPDVVLTTLIGTHSITFNRAFAEVGLASKMLRFCGAMDETVLLGLGADDTENLHCSSGYFTDFASRDNDAFRSRYEATFGPCAPPMGDPGIRWGPGVQVRRSGRNWPFVRLHIGQRARRRRDYGSPEGWRERLVSLCAERSCWSTTRPTRPKSRSASRLGTFDVRRRGDAGAGCGGGGVGVVPPQTRAKRRRDRIGVWRRAARW